MKIDANSDGSVDWDEFTNFMLLENQGTLNMREHADHSDFVPQDFADPNSHSYYHREMIDRIILLDKTQPSYVTTGRDGLIKIWNAANLQHSRTICNRTGKVETTPQLQQQRQLAMKAVAQNPAWISNCIHMTRCNGG